VAREVSIPGIKTLKNYENAIKFNGVMKYDLMRFSWYWKTSHETCRRIFMVFVS